eukprot:769352_1
MSMTGCSIIEPRERLTGESSAVHNIVSDPYSQLAVHNIVSDPYSQLAVHNIVSDPYSQLAVKNAKQAGNCTEMHLASRNIECLGGFERFVNLRVLYLNGNRLTNFTNCDSLIRLKGLFLQENKLTTLKGSLRKIHFLESLQVGDNQLRDLHATLRDIVHLKQLEELEFDGNPLAEEMDYRLHVIQQFPALKLLDMKEVTADERAAAKKLYKELAEQRAFRSGHLPPPVRTRNAAPRVFFKAYTDRERCENEALDEADQVCGKRANVKLRKRLKAEVEEIRSKQAKEQEEFCTSMYFEGTNSFPKFSTTTIGSKFTGSVSGSGDMKSTAWELYSLKKDLEMALKNSTGDKSKSIEVSQLKECIASLSLDKVPLSKDVDGFMKQLEENDKSSLTYPELIDGLLKCSWHAAPVSERTHKAQELFENSQKILESSIA